MQNVEKWLKDSALTKKEGEMLFSLSKDTIMYNFYKYAKDHYFNSISIQFLFVSNTILSQS